MNSKKPQFSLIVPVYNVQDFLAECLDSCINQTFKDIEIICINDCSPDESGKILEKYAKSDSRIKICNHERNEGLGGARNTGITAAVGEYCWLIDSDDFISLIACERLQTTVEKTNADIVRFNKNISWPHGLLLSKPDYTKLRTVEVQAWAYITRTRLLKTQRFRSTVIHEDIDFSPRLFSQAESIYCIPDNLYFYRKNTQSITSGRSNPPTEKSIKNRLLASDALYEYILSAQLPPKHFCTRTMVANYILAKIQYAKQRDIHSAEFDAIIAKIDPFFSTAFLYLLRTYYTVKYGGHLCQN